MVFKAKTLDLAEDINTTFPVSLPPSPRSTICLPLGLSFTRSIAVRVSAGVSQLFTAPRLKPACLVGQKFLKLPHIAPADIDLEILEQQFPHQKQLRRFTYQELDIATDSFAQKNVVGHGGSGMVYEGRLSCGYQVAVKKLREVSFEGQEEFKAEVEVGKLVMHRNVVPLIGFCATESKKLLLVFPFMGNGSLRSRLYKCLESQPPMDWDTRKRIALGVARGLSYLHDNCFHRIIHRDIKSSNIMLDEKLEPHIVDFGLARVMDHKLQVGNWSSTKMPHNVAGTRSESQIGYCPGEHEDDHSEIMTAKICGTYGYMPPEYIYEGKYSAKTDVFAFGIMLLELISSRDAAKLCSLANSEGVGQPADWVKRLVDTGNLNWIVDSSLRGDYSETGVERLIKLSLICTQLHSPAKRPDMSEVVSILEGSRGSLDTRWEEFQQNWLEFVGVRRTAFNQEFCASSPGTSFANSASDLDPEELSGPR